MMWYHLIGAGTRVKIPKASAESPIVSTSLGAYGTMLVMEGVVIADKAATLQTLV